MRLVQITPLFDSDGPDDETQILHETCFDRLLLSQRPRNLFYLINEDEFAVTPFEARDTTPYKDYVCPSCGGRIA